MSMLVVLPDAGEFEAVEAAFDVNHFQESLSNWEYSNVTVHMPRFDYETTLDLADTLSQLGMSDAFGANADFSGIADPTETNEPLMINKVLHRANITVDEKGTEAAAATVVGLGGGGGPQNEPIDFYMDRPFLFYIYDNASQSILFMGRVLDPSNQN